jgi:hypothetical protein
MKTYIVLRRERDGKFLNLKTRKWEKFKKKNWPLYAFDSGTDEKHSYESYQVMVYRGNPINPKTDDPIIMA